MSAVGRGLDRVIAACGAAAALVFGVLTALVTLDVLMRNAGAGGLPWVLEVAEYGLPAATFLSAPWLLRRGEHVRIDVAATALPARLGRWLGRAVDGVGLAIALAFVHYGAVAAYDAWRIGARLVKTLDLPEWWLLAPVPLSGALLAAEFIRRLATPARSPG